MGLDWNPPMIVNDAMEEAQTQMRAEMCELVLMARHAAARMPDLEHMNITATFHEGFSVGNMVFHVYRPEPAESSPNGPFAELSLHGPFAGLEYTALEEAWTATIQEKRKIALTVRKFPELELDQSSPSTPQSHGSSEAQTEQIG